MSFAEAQVDRPACEHSRLHLARARRACIASLVTFSAYIIAPFSDVHHLSQTAMTHRLIIKPSGKPSKEVSENALEQVTTRELQQLETRSTCLEELARQMRVTIVFWLPEMMTSTFLSLIHLYIEILDVKLKQRTGERRAGCRWGSCKLHMLAFCAIILGQDTYCPR